MRTWAKRQRDAATWFDGGVWRSAGGWLPRPAVWPFVGAGAVLCTDSATRNDTDGLTVWAGTAADSRGRALCTVAVAHSVGLGAPVCSFSPARLAPDPHNPAPELDQCWTVDDPTGAAWPHLSGRAGDQLNAWTGAGIRFGTDTDLLVAATLKAQRADEDTVDALVNTLRVLAARLR